MKNAVDFEIENWARWCHYGDSGMPKIVRCNSIESKYRAPRWEGDEPSPIIHFENAQKVQKIWEGFGKTARKVICAEYISPVKYRRHISIYAASQRVGVHQLLYEKFVQEFRRRINEIC